MNDVLDGFGDERPPARRGGSTPRRVVWISSRSALVMVLFLMVMGNIPIVYQIGIADASKKCMRLKKNYKRNLTGYFTRLWVEIKNRGLKIGGISASLTY